MANSAHGGFDGGAQAEDGTLEKDINLLIARKFAALCRLGGFSVIMTRDFDTGTEADESVSIAERKKSDMRRRLQIIEEHPHAIFVSIHLNKFTTTSAKGAQIFYSPNNDNSKLLAQTIQTTICSLLQPENDRAIKKAENSIYLLKKSTIPSVIVECGFLSSLEELKLLKSSDYQSKMAFSIYCGLLEYNKQEKTNVS